jgi:uncharacterized protein
MSTIDEILQHTAHRPYPMPNASWTYYQEWNQPLFFHWELPYELLRKCVPAELPLDSFNGKYYVSLVAFSCQNVRPKYLPAVSFVSDFHQINIRTYVTHSGKKGVYFLNIEAGKWLPTYMAKWLSGLPYEKADIERSSTQCVVYNAPKGNILQVNFSPGKLLAHKSDFDYWLTERYCLYVDHSAQLYRYEVQHKEWELKEVSINQLKLNYRVGPIMLSEAMPFTAQYSDGIQVVAWGGEKI